MIRKLIACVFGLCAAMPLWAQEAPDAVVRNTTNEVISLIKGDKAIQAGDTQRAIEIVNDKVLKIVDMPRMTAQAVGLPWRSATPDQKTALTREFQNLIVRTYSNVLVQYKDEQIVFKPFKMQPNDDRAMVHTEVRKPGAKPIPIDYELAKDPDGWKVFDVVVADVSLVTNYRDSFGQEVKDHGIDGLIASLQEKNKQLAAKPAEAAKKGK